MKEPGESKIPPRRAVVPEEAAYIDLVRTTEFLCPFAQVFKAEELSPAQYNVLRILRGSPDGLTCGEIGNRVITRDPDITRLLDRMEKRGLISRLRGDKDRRVVLTSITRQGLALLARLDKPVREIHRRLLGHLGAERLEALRQLLEACRSEAG